MPTAILRTFTTSAAKQRELGDPREGADDVHDVNGAGPEVVAGLWKETSLTPLTGRIKIQHVQATVNVTALSLDFPVAADKRVVT